VLGHDEPSASTKNHGHEARLEVGQEKNLAKTEPQFCELDARTGLNECCEKRWGIIGEFW